MDDRDVVDGCSIRILKYDVKGFRLGGDDWLIKNRDEPRSGDFEDFRRRGYTFCPHYPSFYKSAD